MRIETRPGRSTGGERGNWGVAARAAVVIVAVTGIAANIALLAVAAARAF